MRKRARVQLMGEVTGVGRSQVQAYFELRDSRGRGALHDLAQRPRARRAARGRAARRGRTGDRRRARLLPGRRPGLAQLQLPRHPRAPGRARATCWPGWRRCASSCAARACSSCRSSWRGRCCRRRSASSRPRVGAARRDLLAGLAPARLGRDGRLGLRAGPGPPRGAGDRRGDAGPRGAAGGRGDRRHPRRRQPRRPLGLLRRDPLPHGGDAAGAGDQRDRPRARLDPDRRRRRGRLLDPDPRRRGGGAARLPSPRGASWRAAGARCGARGRGRSAPAPATSARWPADRRGRCSASAAASTRRSARSAPPPNAGSPSAAASSGGSRRSCSARARRRGIERAARRGRRRSAGAARRSSARPRGRCGAGARRCAGPR